MKNYKLQILLLIIFFLSIVLINRLLVGYKSETKGIINNTTNSILNNENSTEQEILCEIQGAVNQPGIFNMKPGDRLKDLINKAGGFNASVSQEFIVKNINLTKKLKDQDKYYIPLNINANDRLVNINNDSIVFIESLPSIGSLTAEKIINNRPYLNLEELITKKVISRSVYDNIKDYITL